MQHFSKAFLLLSATLLINLGCRKTNDSNFGTSDAVITGFDNTECFCCGGFIVNIINNPPYSDNFLARDLPAGSNISASSDFPVYVKIAWQPDTTDCERHIIITQLIKK